jgi:aerobic-type carbon monoxide dehydrogenase small subunit (CoxS/CutS family)
MNKVQVEFTINGKKVSQEIEPRLLLSDFIRDYLKLTGTHVGCEHGVCGACTIIVNGEAVRSCLMLGVHANGTEIQTVESLVGEDGTLHPLQQAFADNHALQCGFCTSGFLMTLVPYLEENPNPNDAEIREAISGNLCRCTGYTNIVRAVKQASETTPKAVV